MSFARAVLLISGLVWVGFGVWLFAAPESLAGVGLEVQGALGRVEVRGFYGGLEIGIGSFLLWCAAAESRFSAGLLAAALVVGVTALGRVAGLALDGGEGLEVMAPFIGLEVLDAALALWARRRLT